MIYFFTYGNDKFEKSRVRVSSEAISSRMFDAVFCFKPQHLDLEFVKKSKMNLFSKGGGYWMWKYDLCWKMLNIMNEGDVAFYADAGCHVNMKGYDRLHDYVKMIQEIDLGILSFQLSFEEQQYTNQKVFEFFNFENKKSKQLMATCFGFKKCSHTIALFEKMRNLCMEHPELFTDEHNDYKKDEHFIDHRHDQSVFSIVRKQMGSIVLPDETYPYDGNWQNPWVSTKPILATRIRN